MNRETGGKVLEEKTISQFSKGDAIQGFFLLKSFALKTSANSNKYMDFVFADRTGEINGKLWDLRQSNEEKYEEYTLVKVRGTVTEWQGQLQFRVDLIRAAVNEDGIRLEDFAQTAPYPPEFMLGEIIKYILQIKNQDIRETVSRILNEKKDNLMHYPAAMKNHHSIRSGLLFHILTMLRMAEKFLEVYPFLNRDLLYGGVILHDMAKIDEMDANELGMVSSYTMEGMLLGHITQGIKMVEKAAKEVGASEEISILLQHMILSHHYEPEYGSPKRPMIPEAEILHYLDIIDARMYDMKKALDATESGGFSERLWLLHNRQLYKTVFTEEEEPSTEAVRG